MPMSNVNGDKEFHLGLNPGLLHKRLVSYIGCADEKHVNAITSTIYSLVQPQETQDSRPPWLLQF